MRLFLISTLLFVLASWLCGISHSLEMLIIFRVLQGAVAGPIIPLSQSLLLNNYPPEKRGMAFGFLVNDDSGRPDLWSNFRRLDQR